MTIYRVKNSNIIAPLFKSRNETFIQSYLHNCMGEAYVDDLVTPKSARIIVGDICFFAGHVNYELICNKPDDRVSEYLIMVPHDNDWEDAIEQTHKEKAFRRMRYAFKQNKHTFDKDKLHAIVAQLPDEYELKMVDKSLYEQSLGSFWAKDLCGNYPDYDAYQKNGLGAVILKKDEMVSGASSYLFYPGGIEIEIDTKEEERRKGLALICGAKLILECLKRDIYPSWDAHNQESLALAQKLGYKFEKKYPAYEIIGF